MVVIVSSFLSFFVVHKKDLGHIILTLQARIINLFIVILTVKVDHIFDAEMKYGSTSLSHNVLVKFTKRYSIECHITCHNMEFAPELFACEQVAGG